MNALEKITAYFSGLEGVEFIYLFGSRAGEPGGSAESDYDIAVHFTAPLSARDLLHHLHALDLDAPVDLIDLRNTTTVIAKEVVTTGKLLFTIDQMLSDLYEARIRTAYCHLNYTRRESLKQQLPAHLLPQF